MESKRNMDIPSLHGTKYKESGLTATSANASTYMKMVIENDVVDIIWLYVYTFQGGNCSMLVVGLSFQK
jgi:hypothetical protein